MQMLEILIEENAYGAMCPMEVAATAPVSALVPALVEELKLPQADLFGNRLVYVLRYGSSGPVLPDNKSLLASGIVPGTKLALDSYVMDGSVATLLHGRQEHAEPDFHSSPTLADTNSFPVLGKDTSGSVLAVKKKRRWSRRAFLMLGAAAIGAGSLGISYAAYRTLSRNSITTQTSTKSHAPATEPVPPKPLIPATAKPLLFFTQHQQPVRSVSWSPGGGTLASGGNDAQLLTWDMDGNVQLRQQLVGPVRAVAWSPSPASQQLVAAALNQLTFFSSTGATLAHLTQPHTAAVTTLAWSPQYPLRLVSGALDQKAVVWNATTHGPETIFTRHTTPIEAASWAADGQTVGSSSRGGVVRVWNAANGQQVHGLFLDAQLPMRALAFAPTGAQLAVGGDDGVVRLWNGLVCQQQAQGEFGTQCLDIPQRLHAHTKPVRALAWSSDARLLATGADDGVLAIWYPSQSHTPLLKVQHNAPVLALAWSPDGKKVATASGNTVTIWALY